MTRKDFELIARTIKALAEVSNRAAIAGHFADALVAHSGNANFDKARFLKACRGRGEADVQ